MRDAPRPRSPRPSNDEVFAMGDMIQYSLTLGVALGALTGGIVGVPPLGGMLGAVAGAASGLVCRVLTRPAC